MGQYDGNSPKIETACLPIREVERLAVKMLEIPPAEEEALTNYGSNGLLERDSMFNQQILCNNRTLSQRNE